jgi:prephenate dehydratase
MITIAFQGELGAYSEEAAVVFGGNEANLLPCRSFIDVVTAVLDRQATHGVLPVDNSIIGRVVDGADAAGDTGLALVQKLALPIHHCLLAPSGATVNGLERVLSHPAALAQCTRFFASHPDIEAIEWYDTAGAAKDVALSADPATAALASKRAALRYRLEVLLENIEDTPNNQTRFVVVARA